MTFNWALLIFTGFLKLLNNIDSTLTTCGFVYNLFSAGSNFAQPVLALVQNVVYYVMYWVC